MNMQRYEINFVLPNLFAKTAVEYKNHLKSTHVHSKNLRVCEKSSTFVS